MFRLPVGMRPQSTGAGGNLGGAPRWKGYAWYYSQLALLSRIFQNLSYFGECAGRAERPLFVMGLGCVVEVVGDGPLYGDEERGVADGRGFAQDGEGGDEEDEEEQEDGAG